MKKILILASAIILVGCQSTPKQLTPTQQANLLAERAKQEQKDYVTIYNETIPTAQGNVQLVGRSCKKATDICAHSEDYLTLVENKSAKKAGAAIALGVVATLVTGVPVTDRLGFRKDELKGTELKPQFPNRALDYAKPVLESWIKTSASEFAPATKPIQRVTVQPQRFYLVYDKLTGEKTYQLRNSLNIGLQNADFSSEYWFHCDEQSSPNLLSQWQANDYSAVKAALQNNVQSCITKLTAEKSKIYNNFAK